MTLPDFPQLDVFSAGVNALYGILLAGQPSHNRDYTAASKEERFRTRMAWCKSFSLPRYAALGAAILIGLIATTAGGVLVDLFSGVTPEIVRPSEQLVTTALLTSTVYSILAVQEIKSLTFFPVTLIAVLIGFLFRVVAVRGHWPSIVLIDAPAAGPHAVA